MRLHYNEHAVRLPKMMGSSNIELRSISVRPPRNLNWDVVDDVDAKHRELEVAVVMSKSILVFMKVNR